MTNRDDPTQKFPAKQTGFTLADLMVALAIGSILTSMAVPPLSKMLNENRMITRIYELIGHINYARSTAITRGKQVVFCKSVDGAYCDSGAEWGDGWIIFIDTSNNQQRDDDEPLLRVDQSLSKHSNIDFGAFGPDDYLTFQPTGMLKMGNGTFTFCPKNREIPPRAVILSKPGRTRISRTKPDGDPLECP